MYFQCRYSDQIRLDTMFRPYYQGVVPSIFTMTRHRGAFIGEWFFSGSSTCRHFSGFIELPVARLIASSAVYKRSLMRQSSTKFVDFLKRGWAVWCTPVAYPSADLFRFNPFSMSLELFILFCFAVDGSTWSCCYPRGCGDVHVCTFDTCQSRLYQGLTCFICKFRNNSIYGGSLSRTLL